MKYLRASMLLALMQNLYLCSSQDSTVGISFNTSTNTGHCNDAGFLKAGIVLEYRIIDEENIESQWEKIDVIPINKTYSRSFNFPSSELQDHLVQFRMLQWEHGGGVCSCWGIIQDSFMVHYEAHSRILNLTGTCPSAITGLNDISMLYCSGSASVPRGFLSPVLNLTTGVQKTCPKGLNQVIQPMGASLQTNCTGASEKIVMSFLLDFVGCGGDMSNFDQGVELAIRNWNETGEKWVPLVFYYNNTQRRRDIPIGMYNESSDTVDVREYTVSTVQVNSSIPLLSLEICDVRYLRPEKVQFRWLATSRSRISKPAPSDVWTLDNVTIQYIVNGNNFILLEDTFDSLELNKTAWDTTSLWNGQLGDFTVDIDACSHNASSLIFFSQNASATMNGNSTIRVVSRMISTAELVFSPATPINAALEKIKDALKRIDSIIENDTDLQAIDLAEAEEALAKLAVVETTPLVTTYFMGDILSRANNITEPESFIEFFLDIASTLATSSLSTMEDVSQDEAIIISSSVIDTLDSFALNVIRGNAEKTLDGITLMITTDSSELNGSSFHFEPREEYSLQVPRQLLAMFTTGMGGVRIISYLFDGIQELFSFICDSKEDLVLCDDVAGLEYGALQLPELGSGVISTALECGDGQLCQRDNMNIDLDEPVIITIRHSSEVQQRLEADSTGNVSCVFWDFLATLRGLSYGEWSEEGCVKSNLSNTSVTVCECYHLTHFAILLSAAPLNLTADSTVALSLSIIGYVGVSVSLFAMTIMIVTFIALKALHNMRNYIHINLCISLGIAQLIFVAGVNQSASDHVPIHCQVIAVLIHYFFLVSFMWMLMEGVVLYVALVRVFVERKKLYLFGFTIISYGVPLLYLGLLALPLGFALPTQPNYGYDKACFLNTETHFIWAFIAPVIVIILINVGFFIKAASIMWHHQKKLSDRAHFKKIRNWLKAAISLVVIMGLTWIVGVLIVVVEELLPLAYIFTIMVAFQGLFIFIIFVLLSKKAREAYTKWWRIKVNESALLRRYFGDRALTTRMKYTSGIVKRRPCFPNKPRKQVSFDLSRSPVMSPSKPTYLNSMSPPKPPSPHLNSVSPPKPPSPHLNSVSPSSKPSSPLSPSSKPSSPHLISVSPSPSPHLNGHGSVLKHKESLQQQTSEWL